VSTPPQTSDPVNLATDPEEQFAFFKRRLRHYLHSATPEDLEDLAQDCWIELDRARSHREPDRIGALMEVIAKRRAIDRLRRKKLPVVSPGEDGVDPIDVVPAPPPSSRDELERVRFVVRQFFVQTAAHLCVSVFDLWFSMPNPDCKKIAAALGKSHDAVRQGKARCIERLREAEAASPGFLSEFLEYMT
jgi:RNA polymerase sigma factor (sigma-70 family)